MVEQITEKMFTLENANVRAVISNAGAELRSLKDLRNGREQMWERDPAVWKQSAPWLFPIVGKLREDIYRVGDRSYGLTIHGFASRKRFETVEYTQNMLHLRLTADEETRACYPWDFELHIAYELEDHGLKITARVVDLSGDTMYFSLGAHPGFACDTGDRLIFECPERLTVHRLTEDTHLLLPAKQDEEETRELTLAPEMFDSEAMILEAPKSRSVMLERRDGTCVRYRFPQVPWLGLWSRRGSSLRYICIEPWFGVDDPIDADGALEKKCAIRSLRPGEEFQCEYGIELC